MRNEKFFQRERIGEKKFQIRTPGKLGSAHPIPQEIIPAKNHFPSSPCT